MNISIRDLINNPHLKTTIIAGENGIDNEITWAHVCELEDPSIWLIGGELVMTNGFVIPNSPEKQVNYLQKLMDCKASGLAIGKDLHAPALSDEFLEYANEHDFPILLTDYEVPWIALSKTVAVTNANHDYARILQVMKLYDLINQSINSKSTYNIIELISTTIEADIQIVDAENKKILFDTAPHKELKQPTHIQLNVPASRPIFLFIYSENKSQLDTLVLNHLSTIVGIIIERDIANYERLRRHGSEVLLGLMEEQYSNEATAILLKEHHLDKQELYLIGCLIKEENYYSSWLHIGLYEQQIPNILAYKDNKLFVLIPAREDALRILKNELPENVHIGISKSSTEHTPINKMYKEAIWALRSAETLNRKIVYYQDSLRVSPFWPNSPGEAQEVVYDFLGELIEYDKNHKSELIRTLYVFLSVNQSWKAAAEALFIHKQTLVYRINRIEEILGKKLNDISNVSEIWIALQIGIYSELISEWI